MEYICGDDLPVTGMPTRNLEQFKPPQPAEAWGDGEPGIWTFSDMVKRLLSRVEYKLLRLKKLIEPITFLFTDDQVKSASSLGPTPGRQEALYMVKLSDRHPVRPHRVGLEWSISGEVQDIGVPCFSRIAAEIGEGRGSLAWRKARGMLDRSR
ncbi:hypothetical protein BJX61DRAFT_460281 [Aspergillus egyptiacus]|nr:hypothetical protein BJX61DRAFT_460281 [Aspergillus egyptiacus]